MVVVGGVGRCGSGGDGGAGIGGVGRDDEGVWACVILHVRIYVSGIQ